ncbi:NAD(P)-binding domain-containing protein [Streptomyces sp. C11-1]|uniref:NAD(P)-binding domain-containing protein n=1 Tax=Streptomyces durocortorensis TaxID=2811104 RepID=A0ABY9W7P1_9ACTN|nr:NAD(P)-binding domain-containing protein [Streptomyces durocortorensis]WNF31086.1 NAD(P)-binding domain-containing protein [Streptomyces durocortorensis]
MSDSAPGTHPRVTVSGVGGIGEVVLARLLASGHPAGRLRGMVRTEDHARRLVRTYAVDVSADNGRAARGAEVLILAVRPDQAEKVLA